MKLIPTAEQAAVIEAAKTGKNIGVKAYAGAAKTSTCVMVAKAVLKDSLYLAFNASIKQEAEEKFPTHVTCKTAHGLAYAAIVKGTKFAKEARLIGYYDTREIREIIKPFIKGLDEEEEYLYIQECISVIKAFCQSASFDLTEFVHEHIEATEDDPHKAYKFVEPCKAIWGQLADVNSKYKTTHDIYLKLYQLSKPDLSYYRVIFLDEFQDVNPVILDIFLRQKRSQLIAVGDQYQSIYAWRGAINAFEALPESGWTYLSLTESFRFGPEIAATANVLLQDMKAEKAIKGRGTKTKEDVKSEAIIVRNNSTLFEVMQELAKKGKFFYVIGDTEDIFSAMYTANTLRFTKAGEKPNFGKYPHKQIASYGSWKELMQDKSAEIQKIVNLVGLCSPSVHAVIDNIKQFLITDRMLKKNPKLSYEITVCTGHKSKGLEWDKVTLTEDFAPRFSDDCDDEEVIEEFNHGQGRELLYVAITRAQAELILSPAISGYLASL